MKVIIAGSRIFNEDLIIINTAIAMSAFKVDEIVSGGARGIDRLALKYAQLIDMPYKVFPADWEKNGRKAGYLRNIQMAEYSDALIAIWDGKSKGTKHMIDIAKKKKLKIFVWYREIK